jgi:hypothetical protein
MMAIFLFYPILVVLHDLRGRQKKNGDGKTPLIFNLDWILQPVLILVVME